jgi:hypothetical protein
MFFFVCLFVCMCVCVLMGSNPGSVHAKVSAQLVEICSLANLTANFSLAGFEQPAKQLLLQVCTTTVASMLGSL